MTFFFFLEISGKVPQIWGSSSRAEDVDLLEVFQVQMWRLGMSYIQSLHLSLSIYWHAVGIVIRSTFLNVYFIGDITNIISTDGWKMLNINSDNRPGQISGRPLKNNNKSLWFLSEQQRHFVVPMLVSFFFPSASRHRNNQSFPRHVLRVWFWRRSVM